MRKIKFGRMTLATLSLAACVGLFGALAAGQAHARGAGGHALGASRGRFAQPLLDGGPSIQPHFNPSIPYTVPEAPETPVSPGSPGSVFGPR